MDLNALENVRAWTNGVEVEYDAVAQVKNHAQDNLKPVTRLLDLRFNYIPAAATDIAATWKRFGFDPHANKQRRDSSGTASPAPRLL